MSMPYFDCYLTMVWAGYMKWDWKKDGETMQSMSLI